MFRNLRDWIHCSSSVSLYASPVEFILFTIENAYNEKSYAGTLE